MKVKKSVRKVGKVSGKSRKVSVAMKTTFGAILL